eukprot:GHRR01008959.1.p1 GENE.GHRR01008959.1~~GHRR01008959.1.p1  ORF type:complete len:293 (+),score=67.09 GHRR01008959.1:132-881(+)
MAVTAQITHVIFDMDGLLLDTETFYTIAQKDICEKHGKQFSWDLKAKMMGKKALDAAQVLIDELGLHDVLTPEQFLKQREEILDRLFPTSPLMPGVEALIRHLYAHKIPIAVATSSHRRHFDIKTQQHKELFKLFNHIITGDQVSKGKPDPEIFERAAAGFDLPPASPAHCLVFEDAPTGVKAALAAGMNVIMVPDPNLSRDHIDGLGAAALLKSLQQFDPNKWGLPSLEVDVQTPAGTDSLQAGIVVN